MTSGDESVDTLVAFTEAAIEWAGGGRGQPLVDAAAEALASGLDSPTLRILAGAPRSAADDEASTFAPDVFEELGLCVHLRMSTEAMIDRARLKARWFLAGRGSPRTLTSELWWIYKEAGYPAELADWSGLDDWYDMLESGVIKGTLADVDKAVSETARALVAR
jgi:hypothetical protein